MLAPDSIPTAPLHDRRRWLATALVLPATAALGHHQEAFAASAATTSLRPRTASTTEGPYYLPNPPVRADITEAMAGVPVLLELPVMDLLGRPLAGLQVDVWHCNAQGLYSGFAGQGDGQRVDTSGKRFLRGRQLSDIAGMVRFQTVYPGWYAGRTTHIHVKVWNDGRQVLTTQFFLPDALNEFLYTQLPAYRRDALRDQLNRTDDIAVLAGGTVAGSVGESADSYSVSLPLVVDPSADMAPERPPTAGPGLPPGADRTAAPDAGGAPLMRVPYGPLPERSALRGAQRLAALLPGAGELSTKVKP